MYINFNNLFSKIPKFHFTLPKKNSLLIFDHINSKYIKSCIDYKNIYEIKFRNNNINLFAFFYSLIFFYRSNFKVEYINFFLKKSKSKILITSNFNRLIIYTIKNYYPDIKVFVIQNGSFGNEFVLKLKNSTYKNFKCDYFFCFSDIEKEKIKKIVKAKFITLGSFKNNFFKKKNTYKKKQVLFISQFRKELMDKPYLKPLFKTEKLLLPIVFNFCKRKNLKLAILPGDKDILSQNIHYKNLLKSENFTLYNRNLNKSYQRTDSSLFTINIDSSLGYESLSRGNKGCFFDFFEYKHKSFMSKTFYKKSGSFYLGYYNKKKINKILQYLCTVNNKVWINQNFRKLKTIPYETNNHILKKIIKNVSSEI